MRAVNTTLQYVMHQLLVEYFNFSQALARSSMWLNNIFVAVLSSRVWEQCIISWLRSPDWNSFLLWRCHDVQSSVLNHIIGNQYTYCYTDTGRDSHLTEVDEQFSLIK